MHRVLCFKCGAQNRIGNQRDGQAVCGRCRAPLPLPTDDGGWTLPFQVKTLRPYTEFWLGLRPGLVAEDANRAMGAVTRFTVLGGGLLLFALCCVGVWLALDGIDRMALWSPPPPAEAPDTRRSEAEMRALALLEVSEPPQPPPDPGIMWNYVRPAMPSARLSLKSAGDRAYLLRLSEASSGFGLIGIYLPPRAELMLNLPAGDYALTYAHGWPDRWYGQEKLFGPDTGFRRAVSRLRLGEPLRLEFAEGLGVNFATVAVGAADF